MTDYEKVNSDIGLLVNTYTTIGNAIDTNLQEGNYITALLLTDNMQSYAKAAGIPEGENITTGGIYEMIGLGIANKYAKNGLSEKEEQMYSKIMNYIDSKTSSEKKD